jgi:hypothetical protein
MEKVLKSGININSSPQNKKSHQNTESKKSPHKINGKKSPKIEKIPIE